MEGYLLQIRRGPVLRLPLGEEERGAQVLERQDKDGDLRHCSLRCDSREVTSSLWAVSAVKRLSLVFFLPFQMGPKAAGLCPGLKDMWASPLSSLLLTRLLPALHTYPCVVL